MDKDEEGLVDRPLAAGGSGMMLFIVQGTGCCLGLDIDSAILLHHGL